MYLTRSSSLNHIRPVVVQRKKDQGIQTPLHFSLNWINSRLQPSLSEVHHRVAHIVLIDFLRGIIIMVIIPNSLISIAITCWVNWIAFNYSHFMWYSLYRASFLLSPLFDVNYYIKRCIQVSRELLKQRKHSHRLIYTGRCDLFEPQYGDDSSAEPYLIIGISLKAHWGRGDESTNAQGEIPAYYISY